MKRVERNPDWLFFKGYSRSYSEKYGISMIRLITLTILLIILISGIFFVLGRFGPSDRTIIDEAIGRAAEAVECWVAQGIEATMNRFNKIVDSC